MIENSTFKQPDYFTTSLRVGVVLALILTIGQFGFEHLINMALSGDGGRTVGSGRMMTPGQYMLIIFLRGPWLYILLGFVLYTAGAILMPFILPKSLTTALSRFDYQVIWWIIALPLGIGLDLIMVFEIRWLSPTIASIFMRLASAIPHSTDIDSSVYFYATLLAVFLTSGIRFFIICFIATYIALRRKKTFIESQKHC